MGSGFELRRVQRRGRRHRRWWCAAGKPWLSGTASWQRPPWPSGTCSLQTSTKTFRRSLRVFKKVYPAVMTSSRCVSVGTRRGYNIINCDPYGRVISNSDGARGIVEMLFCTSLLALVGASDQPQSSPRKLQIVNTKVSQLCILFFSKKNKRGQFQKRKSIICELLFPSSILAVKMNRKTLVIVLETEIYTYDISNMRLLHVIETTPNPEGEFTRLHCVGTLVLISFLQLSARFLPLQTIRISPTHRQSHRHPPHSQQHLRHHHHPPHLRPRTATSTSSQPAH